MNDGIDELLGEFAATAAIGRSRISSPERRAVLRALVQPYPAHETPPARTIEQVDLDNGLRRERIVLEVLPGVEFAAYVFVPTEPAAPRPAVLAVHGHGYGSRQVSGLFADGSPDSDGTDGYHHFALALACRGLVVIAPDLIGFGPRMTDADRAFDVDAPSACYRLSQTLLLTGHSLLGLRVAELLGVLRHVRRRPEVAPDRIGIMGHSGGATLSMVTLANDDTLAAGVLSGYPNTFGDSILRVRHCACNYLPGILTVADLPDLLSLALPRPLFLESGARDPIFPVAGFRRAVAAVRSAYTAAGVADRLGSDEHPGAHEVSGRVSYDWLAEQLTLTKNPATQGETP